MGRELEEISASTAKWAKGKKHFVRRLLDAERVAKELEGVMSKIHATNERFLV
jgi:PAB1-binding protein PBP1